MQYKQKKGTHAIKDSVAVSAMGGLTVQLSPNDEHEYLMHTDEVARGYGISSSTLRSHKQQNADDLIEGKHYFACVQKTDAGKPPVRRVFWTKRGIIRLGFFIKSKQARKFRDWAEDYIMKTVVEPQADMKQQLASALHTLIPQAAALAGSRNNLANRIGVSAGSLSLIMTGHADKFAIEFMMSIERSCRHLLDNGMAIDMTTIDALMKVDDSKARLALYNKMKKGGVL